MTETQRSAAGPGGTDGPVLLLDSASLWFRAFYGVPSSLTADDGTPVNAIRGFCDMVARLVRARQPSAVVACLDRDWRPAFRVRALPSYKAHRVDTSSGIDPSDPTVGGGPDAEAAPPELGVQVPVILDVLAAAGIPTAGAEGFEADDVIGTLASGEATRSVEVVTGDRDLLQLVRDAPTPVRIVYIARGVSKYEVYGPEEVATKYNVPVGRAGDGYAEMAMLRGDPSDGLPGVPGVGEKTASQVVSKFDSWAELITAVVEGGDARLSSAVRQKLVKAAPYLTVAPEVVLVAKDAPIDWTGSTRSLPHEPADPDALAALAERWSLTGSVDRLTAALAGQDA
ncbi:5'-3' exonuclease [Actinomycetospora sp. CA-084318]|uniref:5'-3' exonuclease n=1 Tax=Actinomycetospora sp. CA-084318 TaxID=3239892 RepID=UPI003D96597C